MAMQHHPIPAGKLMLPAEQYTGSNRSKWLDARRLGLGASEVAGILGLSPWLTPYKVWKDKTSTVPPVELDTEPIEWGHAHEAAIARRVSTRYPELGKIAPSPGLLQHDEAPHVLATVDRLLVPRGPGLKNAPAHAVLEIKNVGLPSYRHSFKDGAPPVYYQVQVMMQLAVTGLDRGYLAVHYGGQHMQYPYLIERDEAAIDALVTYAEQWWADHVETGIAPPLILADNPDLAAIYPGDKDLSPMVAGGDILEEFSRYVDAARREKEAKAEKEAAGFVVKKALGDQTALIDDFGTVLATWNPRASSRFDTTAFRKDHPELAKQYTKRSATRTFNIKEN